MLINDANSGASNWVSTARSLIALYGVHKTDNLSSVKSKVIPYYRSKVMEDLKEWIVLNKKLCTYASLKNAYKFEYYLVVLSSEKTKSNVAKLRLSANNLTIETERFGKKPIPRADRICLYCHSLDITSTENEIHFLLVGPLYQNARSSTQLCAIYCLLKIFQNFMP